MSTAITMNLFKNFTQEDKKFVFDLSFFEVDFDPDDGSYIYPEPVTYTLPSGKEVEISEDGDLEHGISVLASDSWTQEEADAINNYLLQNEVYEFDFHSVIRHITGGKEGLTTAPSGENIFTRNGKTYKFLGQKYQNSKKYWSHLSDSLQLIEDIYECQDFELWDEEAGCWTSAIGYGTPNADLIETKIIYQFNFHKLENPKEISEKYSDFKPGFFVKSREYKRYIAISDIPAHLAGKSNKGNLTLPWHNGPVTIFTQTDLK